MIEIEYLGETEDGKGCMKCGHTAQIKTFKKVIFNTVWEVGKPKKIPIKDFNKYMLTGLFKKV